jgi:radical SAM protein with 4Fe4S-binding SPASM domain
MQGNMVPILRSSAILRPERFGGYLLNHYLPPEIPLDPIRFKIATLCDGVHTLDEIRKELTTALDHSGIYVNNLIAETLQRFDSKLLLYWREHKQNVPLDLPRPLDKSINNGDQLTAPLSVIWEITRRCNLKCKHCFSSSGRRRRQELTTAEAKTMIDTLAQQRVFYVSITGGEPLMRDDLFELLNYASERRLSIDLSTNGYLVNDDVIAAFKDTNVFTVQVSVDGLREEHDRFRGVRGSFARIEKAIELLRDAQFGVVVSTTINQTNLGQISDIIDWATSVGVRSFKTTLFMPKGRGKTNEKELALGPKDVKRLAQLMTTRRQELTGKMELSLESCYPWLMDERPPKGREWYEPERIGCAAGTTNLFITANGDVVPCPFLTEMVIGNVRNGDFENIWESESCAPFRALKTGDLKGKCGSCELLGLVCYGGCRAAALAKTGDIYGPDPYCWKGA